MLKNCPAGIYLLKANNRDTTTECEICSKLIIKAQSDANGLLLTLNIFHTLFWFWYSAGESRRKRGKINIFFGRKACEICHKIPILHLTDYLMRTQIDMTEAWKHMPQLQKKNSSKLILKAQLVLTIPLFIKISLKIKRFFVAKIFFLHKLSLGDSIVDSVTFSLKTVWIIDLNVN